MQRRLARQTESLARYSKINTPKGEQLRDKTLAELQKTTAEISRLAIELRARRQGVSPEAIRAAATVEEEMKAETAARAEAEAEEARRAEAEAAAAAEARAVEEEAAATVRKEEEFRGRMSKIDESIEKGKAKKAKFEAWNESQTELLAGRDQAISSVVDSFPDKAAMADRWQDLERSLDLISEASPLQTGEQVRSEAMYNLKQALSTRLRETPRNKKMLQSWLAEAMKDPEGYFTNLTNEILGVEEDTTDIEQSEAYKDLYRELGAVVSKNDVDGAIAFKEKLRKMSRGAGSEMQAAAKLLWDKLQEVETPGLERLPKPAEPLRTAEAPKVAQSEEEAAAEKSLRRHQVVTDLRAGSRAAFARKREEAAAEARAKADEAGKRYEERVAEFRKHAETQKSGTTENAATSEANEEFSKDESRWFEESNEPGFDRAMSLAEYLDRDSEGNIMLDRATELLKTDTGRAIMEAVDMAHVNGKVPLDGKEFLKAMEELHDLKEEIAKTGFFKRTFMIGNKKKRIVELQKLIDDTSEEALPLRRWDNPHDNEPDRSSKILGM